MGVDRLVEPLTVLANAGEISSGSRGRRMPRSPLAVLSGPLSLSQRLLNDGGRLLRERATVAFGSVPEAAVDRPPPRHHPRHPPRQDPPLRPRVASSPTTAV